MNGRSMKQSIGIGALIEDEAFNALRKIELQIASKSGNWYGLFQPPHITIKRPFKADNKALQTTKKLMFDLAAQTLAFDVVLQSIEHFGTNVVYASLQETKKLNDMHVWLIDNLRKNSVAVGDNESQTMIYHSTLTMNTTKVQFNAAIIEAQKQSSAFPLRCPIRKLGLFLNIDGGKHWIVIAEAALRT